MEPRREGDARLRQHRRLPKIGARTVLRQEARSRLRLGRDREMRSMPQRSLRLGSVREGDFTRTRDRRGCSRSNHKRMPRLLGNFGFRQRSCMATRRQGLHASSDDPDRHRYHFKHERRRLRSVPRDDPISGRREDLSRLRHQSKNVPDEGKRTRWLSVAEGCTRDSHASDGKHVRP
jgi:hypothetical protein